MTAMSLDTRVDTRDFGTWILQGLVSGVSLADGIAKLSGIPFEVELFAQIGLGQWFRVLAGLTQIAGALAMLHRRTASIAGLWLAFAMFSAAAVNSSVLHISPAPAMLVGLASIVIAYLRSDELLLFSNLLVRR